MELNEFVSECLKQIFSGVSAAKKDAGLHGFQVNPWIVTGKSDTAGILIDRETRTPVQIVEFDVAVTTTDSSQKKAGAGILVASIGLGGQLQSDLTNTVLSRIKFSVPIALPRASHVPVEEGQKGTS